MNLHSCDISASVQHNKRRMHNRVGPRRRVQQVQTCRDLVPGYAQGFRHRLLDSIQGLGGGSHGEGAGLIRQYQSALRLHVEVLLGWQLVPARNGRRRASTQRREEEEEEDAKKTEG